MSRSIRMAALAAVAAAPAFSALPAKANPILPTGFAYATAFDSTLSNFVVAPNFPLIAQGPYSGPYPTFDSTLSVTNIQSGGNTYTGSLSDAAPIGPAYFFSGLRPATDAAWDVARGYSAALTIVAPYAVTITTNIYADPYGVNNVGGSDLVRLFSGNTELSSTTVTYNGSGLDGSTVISGVCAADQICSVLVSARPGEAGLNVAALSGGVLLTAVPTPEPTTLAILGAGLAGLGFARRRSGAAPK